MNPIRHWIENRRIEDNVSAVMWIIAITFLLAVGAIAYRFAANIGRTPCGCLGARSSGDSDSGYD